MLGVDASSELRSLLADRGATRPSRASSVAQISVRLPVELHERARAAAARSGLSLTALVERALLAEIARIEDPSAQFADRVAGSILRRVSDALADGTWDEAVAAYAADDPDLAG